VLCTGLDGGGVDLVDGSGPLPDSNWECLAWIGIAVLVAGMFTVFSGLDSQVAYAASAPSDYFLSTMSNDLDSLYFTENQLSLMNSASKNSLGPNSIGAERGYCGGVRNGNVRQFRLADVIHSSDRTSIQFACGSPFEIAVHTHPSGSDELSEGDRSIENPGLEYTCIQYSEISASPVTGRLNGISCFDVDSGFESIPVLSK